MVSCTLPLNPEESIVSIQIENSSKFSCATRIDTVPEVIAMPKALSDFDAESYPWDSVWEYILDDKNFEETSGKKKPWSSSSHRRHLDEASDSDSAYDNDDDEREDDRDIRRNIYRPTPTRRTTYTSPKTEKQFSDEKPKRSKLFVNLLKYLKRKPKASRQENRVAEISREKFRVRFQDEDRDTPRSDFRLSRVPSFLRRRDGDDVSVSGNQSVQSESSSVFRMLQWGKKQDAKNEPFENLSDDDALSDEVSVMESIFNLESRSDFDVDDRNRHRAKQRWRSRERQQQDHREIRRSLSDLFIDTRETSSVNSSQSRKSRSTKIGYGGDRRHYGRPKPIISDDISVASYLLETHGGYLVHVPESITIGSRRTRRRRSFQAY